MKVWVVEHREKGIFKPFQEQLYRPMPVFASKYGARKWLNEFIAKRRTSEDTYRISGRSLDFWYGL